MAVPERSDGFTFLGRRQVASILLDRGRCSRWQVLFVLFGSYSRVCSGTSVCGHLLRQRHLRNDVAASLKPAVAAAAILFARFSLMLGVAQRHQRNDVAASLKSAVAAAARCTQSFRPRCHRPAVAAAVRPSRVSSSQSLNLLLRLLDQLSVSEHTWSRRCGVPNACCCGTGAVVRSPSVHFLAFSKDRCRPSRTFRRLLSFPRYTSSTKTTCLPSPLFWDFSHGSFNVDITRATVLLIVGESVLSLPFVVVLTHLVSGHFSQYFLRDSRLENDDQQVLGCKPRDFPAALVLGAFLLLRRSIGMARRSAWVHSCTSGRSAGIVVSFGEGLYPTSLSSYEMAFSVPAEDLVLIAL